MNIAEVLLRLGCALVAWIVIITHVVWLGTLRAVGCGPDGDQLWRLLLGFAAVTIGFSFLLDATRRISAVHDILRWGVVPVGFFALFAVLPVLTALTNTTLGGAPICGGAPVPAWHVWWAPVQVLTLSAVAFGCWRAFRKSL